MRERSYDVRGLLEKPEPFGLPFDLTREWDLAGVEELSEGERHLYLADGYFAEVSNGGHELWLDSLYGEHGEETADALDAIGMPECAAICRRAFAAGPEADPSDLDSEHYDARDREDDVERSYRYIAEHPAQFGIDPTAAPDADEVIRRLREAEARERESSPPEADAEERGPVPEADTFRTKPRRILVLLGPALLLVAAAFLVPGEGLLLYRLIAAAVGLAFLRVALLRALFRVRMIPEGILVTGEPGIPWTAITGGQLLSVNPHVPENGFRIEYRSEAGEMRYVTVPGTLARYDDAWRMFLSMTVRHGSPWSYAKGIRKSRELGADRTD